MTRARPQKVTTLRDAEKKKMSTWLPSNGNGIGLWKGRRTYYVNGIPQISKSGLTINRNPVHDSARNIVRGLFIGTGKLAIQGAKDIYGLTKGTSNALLGMASPWNLAAMNRTKRNIAALGVTPKKQKQLTEKQKLQIAKNEALKMQGDYFQYSDMPSDMTPKQKVKTTIKENINSIDNAIPNATDENTVKELVHQKKALKKDQNKLNSNFPAGMEVQPLSYVQSDSTQLEEIDKQTASLEKKKGRTKWVGANTTWVDRWGNVIAPKVKGPTKEEQKRMIMTSLEQEMYD